MACLCPDRVVLGLGTGEALNETTVTGARGLNQLVFHGPAP